MSRTKNDGLAYFPLDTGFFKDERIRRLASRFGADGPLFYVYVLCRAYESGYYVLCDADFVDDAALEMHCTTEKIELMMDYLSSRSLIRIIPLDTVKVLTSHGIQAQYQRSAKGRKRDIDVDATLWLLDSSETEGFVKVRQNENKSGNYPINPGNKPINPGNIPKVKESKVKESKGNIGEGPASPSAPPPPPYITLALSDGSGYAVTASQLANWKNLYPDADVPRQLQRMAEWLQKNPSKRRGKSGILDFIHKWLSEEQNKAQARKEAATASKVGAPTQDEMDRLDRAIREMKLRMGDERD